MLENIPKGWYFPGDFPGVQPFLQTSLATGPAKITTLNPRDSPQRPRCDAKTGRTRRKRGKLVVQLQPGVDDRRNRWGQGIRSSPRT